VAGCGNNGVVGLNNRKNHMVPTKVDAECFGNAKIVWPLLGLLIQWQYVKTVHSTLGVRGKTPLTLGVQGDLVIPDPPLRTSMHRIS